MEETKSPPGNPIHPSPPTLLQRDGFQITAGLLPFVLLGLGIALAFAPLQIVPIVGLSMSLTGLIGIFVGLLIGWLAGFPRWTPPYVVLALLIPLYLMHASTPGLVILNMPLFGSDMWGWRAWLLPGAIALIGLAFSRPPWGSLFKLVRGIWQDWTRLSFGLYASLVFVPLLGLDEIDHSWRFPPLLLASLLVILGAYLYLRLKDWRAQLLSLLGCASLVILIVAAGSQVYWQTHDVNFTTGVQTFVDRPIDILRMIKAVFGAGSLTLPLLILPGLIGLIRRVVEVLKQPQADARV